ncbi:MAG: T9SS type A sorting domain-containing protein [Saprospiraceae bacterium]|nr:T9SS type A sorting domain-containing protein [Saprospiraceae bacterium]
MLLATANYGASQTHLDIYNFQSQQQIDSFPILYPSCISINDITISDTAGNIVNVAPLRQIKKTNTVFILNNKLLKSVDFLNEVDSIDAVLIEDNAIDTLIFLKKVKSMSALSLNQESKMYISGLDSIDSLAQILIFLPKGDTSSVSGFNNLRVSSIISISGSVQLHAFNKLSKVRLGLSLSSTKVLRDLREFSALKKSPRLSVSSVESQSFSLDGLENMDELGTLGIGNIASFKNFTPLSKVAGLKSLTLFNMKADINLRQFNNPQSIESIMITDITGSVLFGGCILDSLKTLLLINNPGLANIDLFSTSVPAKYIKFKPQMQQYLYRYNQYSNKSLILVNNANLYACSSQAICQMVTSLGENDVVIINNGLECNDVDEISSSCIVSLNETHLEEVSIYPNPVHDLVKIIWSNKNSGCTVNVFDQLGRKIHTGTLIDNSYSFDVSQLVSGKYLVQLIDHQSKKFVFKSFIKW